MEDFMPYHKTHSKSLNRQLKIGKRGEQILDSYFSRWYKIQFVPLKQEREFGIDRIFENSRGKFSVEYKYDRIARTSKNAFIELVGDVEKGYPGWAIKCQADWIAYLVGETQIFIFTPEQLRRRLPEWLQLLPSNIVERSLAGNAWTTKGLLLPLSALATISRVVALPPQPPVLKHRKNVDQSVDSFI